MMQQLSKLEWLKWGFMGFQTLATCTEMDLFPFISEGKNNCRSFAEIAEYLKFPQHSVRILLFNGCANGLLIKNADDTYSNHPSIPTSNPDEYEILKLQNEFAKKAVYPALQDLTESLRAGTNLGLQSMPGEGDSLYERLSCNPDLEQCFQKRMAKMSALNRMPFLADVLREHDRKITHLLDIGGGNGNSSCYLCEQFPDMKATLFDLATVCEKAKQNISARGLTHRVDTYAGDIFTDAFPVNTIDGILFAALLTIFSEEKILFLLDKAYKSLSDGGQVLIHTITSNENETAPLVSASMSLYFSVLASGAGMAYPVRDYQRWLHQVGFSDIRVIPEPSRSSVAVILARK